MLSGLPGRWRGEGSGCEGGGSVVSGSIAAVTRRVGLLGGLSRMLSPWTQQLGPGQRVRQGL